MQHLPEWIGIFIGIIFGISGLVLGIMNYLRDNPKVSISLQWDMKISSNVPVEKDKLYGVICITNIGRRPIFVSHVSICIPSNKELLITNSIFVEKLSEGDSRKIYPVQQEGLEEFCEFWDKMYAVVRDSSGKKYFSSRCINKPS
jgi:hypothetical protein